MIYVSVEKRMGIPILNHLLPLRLLVELYVQTPLKKNLCVPSVLDMVAIRLASNPLLTLSIQNLFFRFQVFHLRTLKIFVIILVIHYDVSLLNVDTGFP